MNENESASVARVKAALVALELDGTISELPASTHTALDAATALGCETINIAKSIIFEAPESKRPVMVVARGDRKVDEVKIATYLNERISKASAEFVRESTGFLTGAVCPIGCVNPMITFFDEGLLALEYVWIAAGSRNSVCRLTPQDVLRATKATVVEI